MAQAGKVLNSIRQSMSLFSSRKYSSISQSRQLVGGGIPPMKALIEPSIAQFRGSEFHYKFISTLGKFRSLNSAGTKSTVVGIAGASFVTAAISSLPSVVHAFHDEDILVDDRESYDASSDRDEFAHAAWMVVRKLWLPAFFILTLLSNWHHPVMLFTKAVLLLLATRPSPLTVYLFVEQLCHKSVRQQPQSFWAKMGLAPPGPEIHASLLRLSFCHLD